jgi:transposase-like protein
MSLESLYKEFPTEEACLEYVCRKRFPRKKLKRVKGRKSFYDRSGRQYYPLKGTIFEHSRTPLMKWFFAIYLFSVSKNGVSAAELQRHLGVTQKCAWRMGHQIRTIMKEDVPMLKGVVEADETYFGKRRSGTQMALIGAVERGGKIKVLVTKDRREHTVVPFLEKEVKMGSYLMTDEAAVYKIAQGFKHRSVTHSKYQWVRGDVHTNTLEGFWSQVKRSIRGTYHAVSSHHLQSYVDQHVFLYNHRENVFSSLMERL